MMLAEVVIGAPRWSFAAVGLTAAMLVLLGWAYWRSTSVSQWRRVALALKSIGVAILCLCLTEPLFTGSRARPGANQFIILADDSRSMTIDDLAGDSTRADRLRSILRDGNEWMTRLAQDFDVRRYAFSSRLRQSRDFSELAFDGDRTSLGSALANLTRRYDGRALAGMILLTDGAATDRSRLERWIRDCRERTASKLAPIYPVIVGDENSKPDVRLERVTVAQTNFEDAPVQVTARIAGVHVGGRTISVDLEDESGHLVEHSQISAPEDGQSAAARFKLRPDQHGVSFYQVRVHFQSPLSSASEPNSEATLENNQQIFSVDSRRGPFRVLYVAGRPNWEYKFLRRALDDDREIQLVGLLRIAKREPRFAFRRRDSERSNPLFQGFESTDDERVEQYDQPVLIRLGAEDAAELQSGFPTSPEELYRYEAVILDDLEAEFFTQDQMLLLKNFVRERGGGLLMLGGQESFRNGNYARTPLGEVLPIYLNEPSDPPLESRFRLELTREGWLEPSLRLRAEERDDQLRLANMPEFHTLSGASGIKPGATMLATVSPMFASGDANIAVRDNASVVTKSGAARRWPALVEQRFGRGRAAALLIGDLWRWELRRLHVEDQDSAKAWRQLVRWLIADVPGRTELRMESAASATALAAVGSEIDASDDQVTLTVVARDSAFAPLENATVTIRVAGPDGAAFELAAAPIARSPGAYVASYRPRQRGAYRAEAIVRAAADAEVGRAETGFTADPTAEEYQQLGVDRDLLERLAAQTGGEVINAYELSSFVATLPTRNAIEVESFVSPLWHRPWLFLVIILCLAAEWGLRRLTGLP